MRSLIAALLLFATLPAAATHAAPTPIRAMVVLPDGRPAAGARVTLRAFTNDGMVKSDTEAVTDAAGRLDATVEMEEPAAGAPPGPMQLRGYMIIDVPECALAFVSIPYPPTAGPIRLAPLYTQSGTVVTRDKAPVAGARVSVDYFPGGWSVMPVNLPPFGIKTPQLVTQTGADGTFTIRGVTVVGGMLMRGLAGTLSVAATIDGAPMAGFCETLNFRAPGGPQPVRPDPPVVISVFPTRTLRGRVVNAVTHQPVAGARVRLAADPSFAVNGVAPVVTGADGKFAFTGVPGAFQTFAVATHPDLSNGFTAIGGRTHRLDGTPDPADAQEAEIALRPWATVEGTVIDEETGKPPATTVRLSAVYSEGYNDGRISVGRAGAGGPMEPDGTFSIRLAVGSAPFYAMTSAYRLSEPRSIDVGPEGKKGVVVRLRRSTGYLVRFESDTPGGLERCFLTFRRKPEENISTNFSPVWFFSAREWGEKMEIRITRDRQDVLPWTEITADPAQWPRVLKLK